MSRENWLERFLEMKGTITFSDSPSIHSTGRPSVRTWQQPRAKKRCSNVEPGFYRYDDLETPWH
ncbi:hypothetical protein FIBSPDRAFT_870537 [Athelia psychrophila]|uniref:Uncharacterized protein n=1 Tax=Athelia psychrophila TaxID=1759441 RepID=A0A166B2B4_9AGAM|nr:hypothetical protein FIBSPDRAFT_870537 [Fibularhizoctonia sp. CBS 109695]